MSIIEGKYTQKRFAPIEEPIKREREDKRKNDFIPKPRLEFYKGLLSFKNPNLDEIIYAFIYWSKFV